MSLDMSSRRKQQKRQTRLTFGTLPVSSAKDKYNPAIQDRLASVRFETSAPRRSPRSAPSTTVAPSLPTPEPSSQPLTRTDEPDSSSSEALLTPRRKKSDKSTVAEVSEEEDEEEDVVVPSSKRRKVNDSQTIQTPTRRSTRLNSDNTPQSAFSVRSRHRATQIASSPPLRAVWDIGSPETSGDDEDVIISNPTYTRRTRRNLANDDPFIVSDDLERLKSSQTKSRPSRSQADFVVDDDEIEYISSDGEHTHTTERHRATKAKRRIRSRREQNELDDDLNNLQDSNAGSVNESASEDEGQTHRRTRGGPVTTARDAAREQIELLKRRRAGEKPERDREDSVDFEEIDGADINDIGINQHIVDDDSTSQSGAEAPEVAETAAMDEYEDDFVVSDEDDQSSHRPQSGIPLAFTSFASRKPRELFVYIVEWLVKNRIAPAFSREDELYRLSWNKVNDQIKAQAGSRLISSAWGTEFKYAVLARPICKFTYISGGDDEFFLNCDACNRTNHPARYEFRFSGHAYHPDTLEPLNDEDEDDENEVGDNTDTASYDLAGHLLPTSSRAFNLGRFCAANAEMGHKLTHWKYHLNQSLLDYLEEQGVLSAEAILAREKLSKKKREIQAEDIVDIMQQTGVIQRLWKDLQSDLEDARFGMEDHVAKNGGRRNKQRIGKVRVNRQDGMIEEHSEGGRVKLVIPDDSEGE